jgi:hypothetical protein
MKPLTDENPLVQTAMGFAPSRRLLEYGRFHLSPPHAQPTRARLVGATVASVVGSLVVDAILVVIGTAVFPSTKGYVHFRFSDYAALTIIGVLIASAGWPVVTRFSSAPRWIFLRLAWAVSAVLLLPDLALLYRGDPLHAVLVLMVMHVAIALVTYNALVRLAPVGAPPSSPVGLSAERYPADSSRFA